MKGKASVELIYFLLLSNFVGANFMFTVQELFSISFTFPATSETKIKELESKIAQMEKGRSGWRKKQNIPHVHLL